MLSEHGLSTYGTKSQLSARHKEYVNLYNANLDRLHPQSQQELLKQVERWDAIQQTLARGEKRKIDGEEWGKVYNDTYAALGRQARENLKKRKVEEKETVNGEGTTVVRSSQEETVA
jgi:E3 ubiquitin-protein ligase RAD18